MNNSDPVQSAAETQPGLPGVSTTGLSCYIIQNSGRVWDSSPSSLELSNNSLNETVMTGKITPKTSPVFVYNGDSNIRKFSRHCFLALLA